MKKTTKTIRFVYTEKVEVDEHKADQQHSVSVDVVIRQPSM